MVMRRSARAPGGPGDAGQAAGGPGQHQRAGTSGEGPGAGVELTAVSSCLILCAYRQRPPKPLRDQVWRPGEQLAGESWALCTPSHLHCSLRPLPGHTSVAFVEFTCTVSLGFVSHPNRLVGSHGNPRLCSAVCPWTRV